MTGILGRLLGILGRMKRVDIQGSEGKQSGFDPGLGWLEARTIIFSIKFR